MDLPDIAECLQCCVQVRAVLGGPKGSKDTAALSDDETIEKCLNEVEAALNAGLNFKGKFNSGLQVLALLLSCSSLPPPPRPTPPHPHTPPLPPTTLPCSGAAAVNTAFGCHVFAQATTLHGSVGTHTAMSHHCPFCSNKETTSMNGVG